MGEELVVRHGHSVTNADIEHAKDERIRILEEENARLKGILDNPEPSEFFAAAEVEARYQVAHWTEAHDSRKSDADWFWLIGYLAGKALHRPGDDSTEKMLHRITTIAAACANWHAAVKARALYPDTERTD